MLSSARRVRAGYLPPGLRPWCAAPPPSELLRPIYSPEGRCQGLIRVYVHQAFLPVLVALQSDRPLMPYRRRIAIRRQSGGGPLQLPQSSGTRWSSPNRSLGVTYPPTAVRGRTPTLPPRMPLSAAQSHLHYQLGSRPECLRRQVAHLARSSAVGDDGRVPVGDRCRGHACPSSGFWGYSWWRTCWLTPAPVGAERKGDRMSEPDRTKLPIRRPPFQGISNRRYVPSGTSPGRNGPLGRSGDVSCHGVLPTEGRS